ncbi:serine/threonine protein kinase [Arachnia propionica]|uniref:non-specific serine/threonine protein kinase n=1 Tax=Arachnia propionica TaxID=1750 RepID=A0A3P1WRF7_9ACTN|nr:serine/threonine protein kinase [Arachnia propionica]
MLGRGGFAIVYEGEQVSLRRPVAVKVDSRPLTDERNRRRFQREMQATSRISAHPHVVTLIDTGMLPDGRPYLVMERCDGGSLADVVKDGPMPALEAVRVVEAVSRALGAAHAAGVLHRDIKPGNILLDSYGAPRLSDFGIAAIQRADSGATATLGALTPAYAPPEAFSEVEPTAAGDVWSMAAVLLRLLTGRGPRSGPDGRSLKLSAIMQSLLTPVDTSDPRIPPGLRPILDRALDPDPRRRFRDGNEFASALTTVLPTSSASGAEVTISRPITFEHPPTWQVDTPVPMTDRTEAPRQEDRRSLLWVGFVAAALVVGGMIWGTVSLLGGSPDPQAAPQPVVVTVTESAPPVRSAPPTTSAPPPPVTTAEPTPSVESSPSWPVNPQGLPATDDMPWPVGTCLLAALNDQEISSATEVPCDQANWHIFAGGSVDPSIPGERSSEALGIDPTVPEICSDHYAQLAGLDVGKPHEIRVMGTLPDEWQAGRRGFSCAYVEQ